MVATTRSRAPSSSPPPPPLPPSSSSPSSCRNGFKTRGRKLLPSSEEAEKEATLGELNRQRNIPAAAGRGWADRKGDAEEEEEEATEQDEKEEQDGDGDEGIKPSCYETLRLQRIAENRARLAALGVQKHASTLTSFFRATKTRANIQKKQSIAHYHSGVAAAGAAAVRRSERLKNITTPKYYNSCETPTPTQPLEHLAGPRSHRNRNDTTTPANAPIPKNCPASLPISPLFSAYRCRSKERGSLYDSIVGICCHFCRQKKLCGEEDCERCAHRNVSKPCLGKTDCSYCHSRTGVFCRACLKIRYGEEIEEVRRNPQWLCPHCSEERGLNPYWICNSSICLSRRKIAPTGIAIYKARELGFKSVAHYLANILEEQSKVMCGA